MSTRIERIQNAVEKMHGGKATHVQSVPVRDVYAGKVVWEGVVEVFDLEYNPRSNAAYAWEIPGNPLDYVAVLKVPPIDDPLKAVKAYVVARK